MASNLSVLLGTNYIKNIMKSLIQKSKTNIVGFNHCHQIFLRNFSRSTTNSQKNMRFIQFQHKSDKVIKLGVLSENGNNIIDLSESYPYSMVEFIGKNISSSEIDEKIKSAPMKKLTDDITLLPPVHNPEKIICIGLNYAGHCKEQNKEPPKNPMFFSKFASALTGPNGNVIAHSITQKIDWEIELAVIIGKLAKHVSREKAFDHVFGYSVAQDISARDWQKGLNGGQFLIGKTMDTFCPLGPAIVHKSLIKDPHSLGLTCKVNGELKQSGNTNELCFRIDDIISRLSQSITLQPGDVILTGTPSGVGMYRNPPEFLKPGDVIESEIECLGKIVNKVVSE